MQKPELSIILPVHNEEKGIDEVAKKLVKLLTAEKINSEIIFVENGSTDLSFKKLLLLKKRYRNILVESSEKGWGNAVKKGIKKSSGKYICYMVSDGQINPKYVPRLFQMIKGKNLAMVKISRITRENPLRKTTSRIYNLLATTLFGATSNDINGTPKILYSKLLKRINLKSTNIAIDLELILYLKRNKLKWKELKINSGIRKRGSSTTNLNSVLEMITNMLYFKWKLLQGGM